MSKHKLLILISIIVFTGLNEVVAQTAYDFYEKNDDGVEIYYKYISSSNLQVEVAPMPSGQLYTGNIRIPSTVTHNSQSYSVVGIGLQAFASCKGLTGVEIPNSVTQIGQLAFSACTSLTNFNFPNALISIGPDAFNGSAITSVWIPNSVESIGQMAFANCSNLKTIRFPENDKFTSIPAKCVMKGTRLESAILPANITSLADYAFWECTSLNYVFCEGNILNEIGDKRQCFVNVPGTCRLIVPQGFTTSTIELTKVYGKGAFLFDSTTDINLSDNTYFYNFIGDDSKTLNVTYERTFQAGNFYLPLFIPFSMSVADLKNSLGQDCKIAHLKDIDYNDGTIALNWSFIESGELYANTPYIIKLESSSDRIEVADVTFAIDRETVNGTFENNGCTVTLTGVYLPENLVAGDGKYVLTKNNSFQQAGANLTLNPYRFYLTCSTPTEQAKIKMNVEREEEQDALESIFYIEGEEDNIYYDLNGRRVDNPSNGIFFTNGKKVLF